MTVERHHEHYVEAALTGEARAVAGTGKGGRAVQLNRAAYQLGQLVGAGVLARDRAEEALASAATDAGLPLKRSQPTIRRGLDAGARQPREILPPGRGGKEMSDHGRSFDRAHAARSRQDARQAARGRQDTRGTNTTQRPAETPQGPPTGAFEALAGYQAALASGPGETYLAQRGIPLDVAQRHGLGYAVPGKWLGRDWIGGRLVVPHHDPDGNLVNLYGRAIGGDDVPKHLRHDHLAGTKGNFNAAVLRPDLTSIDDQKKLSPHQMAIRDAGLAPDAVLRIGGGPVYVCEGAFDALALIAAGLLRTIAIFGKSGWRWDWARGVDELVIAFDADAGAEARDLARQALLRGKRASILPPEAYGGHKDASAAWAAGVLTLIPLAPAELRDDVEERAAILQYDAGLPRLEAEHQALAEFSRCRESAESCRKEAECFQDAENAADGLTSATGRGGSNV